MGSPWQIQKACPALLIGAYAAGNTASNEVEPQGLTHSLLGLFRARFCTRSEQSLPYKADTACMQVSRWPGDTADGRGQRLITWS